MPQSVLNRGSNTILNSGAWNDSPDPITLNLNLSDTLSVSESLNLTITGTANKSYLDRGAATRLDAGAFCLYIDPITKNLNLSDTLSISESISLNKAKSRAKSILYRGSETILDIGAAQWIADYAKPKPRRLFPPPLIYPAGTKIITPERPGDYKNLWELERSSFDYRVYKGTATDNYSSYINFPFQSYYIDLLVWDVVIIDFMLDISNSMVVAVRFGEYLQRVNSRAFRIKNAIPGINARYQLTIFR